MVGNVVQVSLHASRGEYAGYGHLKGLWLWRDIPYMRIQYLAGVDASAAADEVR